MICDQNNTKNNRTECQETVKCPFSAAHNKLQEAHRFWHQAAHEYSDPVGFRTNLNACIQALRNVTFVLQKQKSIIPNYESWYSKWQEKMRADPILKWIVQARNIIVKEGDLETKSIARASVLANYYDPPYKDFLVFPLTTTQGIAEQIAEKELPEVLRRHGILQVERRWIANDLPEHELLEALSHAYGVLSLLIDDAHSQIGLAGISIHVETENGKLKPIDYPTTHLKGRLPCMVASERDRTVWIKLSTKEFLIPITISKKIPVSEKEIKERYGTLSDSVSSIKNIVNNLKNFADSMFEIAKIILCIDGYHTPLVCLILPNDKIIYMPLEIRDRSEKFIVWSMVADEVKRTGAKAIIAISEIWIAPQDPKHLLPPSESPDRTEALDLIAASNSGEEYSYICHFERIDGSIVLGETNINDEGHAYFIEPIRKVWGISTKPLITLKKYKVGRNSPCPCRSGRKFKNCCKSISEYSDYHPKKALSLYEQGNYEEAEIAFRRHLTKYIVWYNEHKIPFLLTDPLNADDILLMDIDAVSSIVEYITNCLYEQNKIEDINSFLNAALDIIDDNRFKHNIESLQKYWSELITSNYH